MQPDAREAPDGRRGGKRRATFIGAIAGAGAVIAVLTWFYPLGRVFDPTVGGDQPVRLLAELALGFIAGVILSPVAAAVGAIVGRWLGGRRIGVRLAVIVTAVSTASAIALFLALGRGQLVDENGSYDMLRYTLVLGVLAAAAGICLYEAAHRWLPSGRPRRRPSST